LPIHDLPRFAFEVNCFFGLLPYQTAQTNSENLGIMGFNRLGTLTGLGKRSSLCLKHSDGTKIREKHNHKKQRLKTG
jgi:hypothetical protein